MKPAKRLAYQFRMEHHGDVCEESVCARLRKEGFRVFTYGNNGIGDELITHLNFRAYAQTCEAFKVDDKCKNKFVFVRADVSRSHRLFLLLHELGHILMGHQGEDVLGSVSVAMEQQANRFAEYALNPNPAEYGLFRFASRWGKVAAVAALALALLCVVVPRPAGLVYVTPSGDCYHRDSCGTIQGKEAECVALSEAREMGKRPCLMCNPE